jgi:hypothetical protein
LSEDGAATMHDPLRTYGLGHFEPLRVQIAASQNYP